MIWTGFIQRCGACWLPGECWRYGPIICRRSIRQWILIIARYYGEVLAGYWPEAIQYIEQRYRTLPFPFDEFEPPEMVMQADWPLDHMAGFLSSWSAAQRYQAEHGRHPLKLLWPELEEAWGAPGQTRARALAAPPAYRQGPGLIPRRQLT